MVIPMINNFKAIHVCYLMYLKTFGIYVLKYTNLTELVFFLHRDYDGIMEICKKAELKPLPDIGLRLIVEKRIKDEVYYAIY